MAEDEQQRYGIYRDEIKIDLNAHYCKKKRDMYQKKVVFVVDVKRTHASRVRIQRLLR